MRSKCEIGPRAGPSDGKGQGPFRRTGELISLFGKQNIKINLTLTYESYKHKIAEQREKVDDTILK